MADEFTEARRAKVTAALKQAARDFIEMDAVPFAEVQIPVTARGNEYLVSIKFEARSK